MHTSTLDIIAEASSFCLQDTLNQRIQILGYHEIMGAASLKVSVIHSILLSIVIQRSCNQKSPGHVFPKRCVNCSRPARNVEEVGKFPNETSFTSDSIERVFIVGCGHSGTTLLYRTIGNLPTVLCRGYETELFLTGLKPKTDETIKNTVLTWDKECLSRGFKLWVEKTPKHITKIATIKSLVPGAKFVFIYRNGRDVFRSLVARGYTAEAAVQRWVDDNLAMIRTIPSTNVFSIRFEDFTDAGKVLSVVGGICQFLGIRCSELQKVLALQAPWKALDSTWKGLCTQYWDDTQKFDDLEESLLVHMGKPVGLRDTDLTGKQHHALRRWQLSQPWQDLSHSTGPNMSAKLWGVFNSSKAATRLMNYFQYLG